jgi:hypothetical protein
MMWYWTEASQLVELATVMLMGLIRLSVAADVKYANILSSVGTTLTLNANDDNWSLSAAAVGTHMKRGILASIVVLPVAVGEKVAYSLASRPRPGNRLLVGVLTRTSSLLMLALRPPQSLVPCYCTLAGQGCCLPLVLPSLVYSLQTAYAGAST